MGEQLKPLNSSIFIPDPNKETSYYATLRKTAIDLEHWAMDHQF